MTQDVTASQWTQVGDYDIACARAISALIAGAGYVAAIVLANSMLKHFGTPRVGGNYFVPVGFGLIAPWARASPFNADRMRPSARTSRPARWRRLKRCGCAGLNRGKHRGSRWTGSPTTTLLISPCSTT
jgi:hypothetical protein